jgi:O-antigen ligase
MPFSGLALILSQTRAWIGALFIVVLFLLIWTKQSSLKKILLIMGIMMGIVFLVGMINLLGVIDMKYFMKAFEGAFRYGSGEKHSTQDLAIYMRLNVWRMAIQHFLEHPFFGIGIGNLRFSNYLTGQLGNPIEGMGYVDNQYIQAFTETGIVGGIAWIVLMYRSIRIGLQSMSKSVGSMLQAPATGFLGSFLIFAIGSLFWVVTPQHESFALMVLYSGMLFNIDTLRDGNMKRGENS